MEGLAKKAKELIEKAKKATEIRQDTEKSLLNVKTALLRKDITEGEANLEFSRLDKELKDNLQVLKDLL